jgi:hypothetical protein
MNTNDVQLFLTEARVCALVMFESSTCIKRDLATLYLPDDLHFDAIELCASLTKTKDEVLMELADFEQLLVSVSIDEASWLEATNLILAWLWGDIPKLNALIKALQASTERQPDSERAALLVAESTHKISEAFNRALTAAKSIAGERTLRLN